MATRIYGTSVGDQDTAVTEGVGSPVAAKNVEVTVDLAATIVKDGNVTGGERTISREEFIDALDRIKNKALSGVWPPA